MRGCVGHTIGVLTSPEADLRAAAEKSNTYLTLAHAKAAGQVSEGTKKEAASA